MAVGVLGVLALDAEHGQTIIADENDVHVRGAVVPAAVGVLGEHRELDFEIHFVEGGAMPRERMLRTYPVEEIVREH